jgi:hypothetical protein
MSTAANTRTLLKKAFTPLQQQAIVDQALQKVQSEATRNAAVNNLKNLLFLSAGAGTTLAGLQTLARLNRDQQSHKQVPVGRDVPIELYGVQPKRVRHRKASPESISYLPAVPSLPAGLLPAPSPTKVASEFGNFLSNPFGYVGDTVQGAATGRNASNPMHIPWYAPAALGVTLAGVGTANYVADEAAKRLRKKIVQQEIAKAEQEYDDALRNSIAIKGASARSKLASNFDRIISVMEKHAIEGQAASAGTTNLAGTLAGLYLAMALGSGVAGLRGGYDSGKSEWKSDAIRRAQITRLKTVPSNPVDIQADPVLLSPPEPLVQ